MNKTKGKERRDNKSRRLCLLHKKDKEYLSKFAVVPHAGTWIEICILSNLVEVVTSFPTRERGLKFMAVLADQDPGKVVPHAGTWIEMSQYTLRTPASTVVPHAGTWIEICPRPDCCCLCPGRSPRGNVDWNGCPSVWRLLYVSLPTWECRLK